MMDQILKDVGTFVLAMTLLVLFSGCATLVKGTDQQLTLTTEKDLEGATCELTDTKGGKWHVDNTPTTMTVQKGDGPMTVICRKEGYKTTTVVVDETVAGATLGNVILGGGIGILVDAASGAAQRYPDQITVWMEPLEWESEEERVAWNSARDAYEAAQAEKEKEQQYWNEED